MFWNAEQEPGGGGLACGGRGQEPLQPGRGAVSDTIWRPRQQNGNQSKEPEMFNLWPRTRGLCWTLWVRSYIIVQCDIHTR